MTEENPMFVEGLNLPRTKVILNDRGEGYPPNHDKVDLEYLEEDKQKVPQS
ncbi:MAG TPA: hypothetical protein VJ227_00175 [Patescibacteria group bacterium]|nr:hypothetical protein [Patescibacteria group bacterium]